MTENPKENIITEDEWQSLKALHLDLATNGSESDAWLIMENIHSRPVSTPPEGAAPEHEEALSLMISENARLGAELKRTQELLKIISGERGVAIRQDEREEVPDERIKDIELIIILCKQLRHHFPDDISLQMTQEQHERELKKIESLRHPGKEVPE